MCSRRQKPSIALALALLACSSSEAGSDATAASEWTLVTSMAEQYDRALMRRCECLVSQGVLYDSVDMCRGSLGWPESGEACLEMALEAHGTDELQDALLCHVEHLEMANACAEMHSCSEVVIDGACDALSAAGPCGQPAIDLFAFIFEHCPELGLQAQ